MFRLDGKSAVITGAASGIGKAMAVALAGQGARVAVCDLDQNAADATAAALCESGGQADGYACDVTDQQRLNDVLGGIAGQHGLDILINNAGIAHIGSCSDTSVDDLDRIYNVNVKGVYNGMHAALPYLSESGGVILNLASIASLVGIKDRFAYSMSKGAVLTMTLSVAMDYLQQQVRCNCICPARVHTPFVDNFIKQTYPGREEEMFEQLSGYQPVGRMAKPEEVAALAVYLCSDEASFITGGVYPIDGGVINLR